MADIKNILKKINFDTQERKQYNVFSVLSLEEKEKIHTTFIAELLNPKGSHRLSKIFLDEFLNIIYKDLNKEELNLSDAEVKTEVQLEGRRIDICITLSDQNNSEIKIGIENKIHAFESEDQLKDYSKSLETDKASLNKLFF